MNEIDNLKKHVKDLLNIDLFLYKEKQLNRRLETYLVKNNIKDVEAYAKLLAKNSVEKEKFLDFVTINVTEFYRNPALYNDLSNILKSRNCEGIKVWSAACSNGAEPYGIAILLTELGIKNFTIHATDLDPNILRKAKAGIYEECEIKSLPEALLNKYFTKQGDDYRINESVKKNVKFKVQNLLSDEFETGYDLVLCRNVVIYFNPDARDNLYDRISKTIKPGGLFFVGATENIHNYSRFGFDKLKSFIYTKL